MDSEPSSAPSGVRAWSLASRVQCKRSQLGSLFTRSAVALVLGFAGKTKMARPADDGRQQLLHGSGVATHVWSIEGIVDLLDRTEQQLAA